MLVDVRYKIGALPVAPTADEREVKITLDVIHADGAALVADLERRLGGWVLSHEIKDIDYVRDTMEVEVTYQVWPPVTHPGHAPHNGYDANGYETNGYGVNGVNGVNVYGGYDAQTAVRS
jgi:hypothetical protein